MEDSGGASLWICDTCGRSFTSPKALGGHMRVHVKDSNTKKKMSMNRSPVGAGNAGQELEREPICPLCGKDFVSMKALFGHMRCHPEREYRGINPPPAVSNVEQHESHDLFMWSVFSWQVTGKRGRKFLSSPQTKTEEELNDEDERKLIEAAETLLMLANSDPLLISEVTNSNSLTNNKVSDDHHENFEKKDDVAGLHEKLLVSSPEIGSKSLTMEDDCKLEIRVPIDQEQAMITQQRPKKKRKLMGIDDNQQRNLDQKYFKCSDCNMVFLTHQALGGHKASHNKQMIKIQNQTNCDDLTAGKIQVVQTTTPSSTTTCSSSPHQCKTCGRVFTTGQALGGHMRRHYVENQASEHNSSTQAAANVHGQTSRKIHAFDLNQLPSNDQV